MVRLERFDIGSGDLDREFGEALAELGALDLHHRGLEARRAAARQL